MLLNASVERWLGFTLLDNLNLSPTQNSCSWYVLEDIPMLL
jgi:hypothetical protein